MDSLLKQQVESQQRLSSSSCAHADKNGEVLAESKSHFGIIAQNGFKVPLTYVEWTDMPKDMLDYIWEEVKDNTNTPEAYGLHCLKNISILWKNCKSREKTRVIMVHAEKNKTSHEQQLPRTSQILFVKKREEVSVYNKLDFEICMYLGHGPSPAHVLQQKSSRSREMVQQELNYLQSNYSDCNANIVN
ncbi:hypothetical protein CUMW_178950 [Citrus unshiu]|nr:hypothetical protein CUMW_178950 [Citrus unshiu]